jgi:hypothetical protein
MMVLLAVALVGCATYQPVPEGYSGPTAVVVDSGKYEDSSKAQLFAMVEVDGNRIMNSFLASANASQGRGFSLSMSVSERSLPAKPMKVTLRGSHTTAAPIHAIASQMAGTFFSVEGVVDFEPKANARYVVRGELKKGASSVWIEDAGSGQVVTKKVIE